MRAQRRTFALIAGAAVTLVAGLVMATVTQAEAASNAAAAVACSAPTWAEGNTYTAGTQVTYGGKLYQALVTHTAYAGAGWNPAATPSLWKDLGACTGGVPTTPPPSAGPSHAPRPRPPQPSTTRPRAAPRARPTTPHRRAGHLRGEVPARREGAAGLLGELGRRLQRRPPGARLDPDHRLPDQATRVQRDQRGVPGDPLRRHGPVGGRHGRRGQGLHARPRCARRRRPARRS